MAYAAERSDGQAANAPIAELVKRASEQTTRLAHQEVELAKAELALKARRAGVSGALFGGAAAVGVYVLGALTAAAVLGLATAVAAWLAAVIVAVAFAASAG